MRTLPPILRLAGRRQEQRFEQAKIEVQEEGPVKKQPVSSSSLGVAGEFELAGREIGMALDSHWLGKKRGQRVGVAFHHEPVCRGDAVKGGFDPQYQRVIQASRT